MSIVCSPYRIKSSLMDDWTKEAESDRSYLTHAVVGGHDAASGWNAAVRPRFRKLVRRSGTGIDQDTWLGGVPTESMLGGNSSKDIEERGMSELGAGISGFLLSHMTFDHMQHIIPGPHVYDDVMGVLRDVFPPSIEIDGVGLPAGHEALAREIERARYLLEDDWDGEGTEAVDRATWNRAVSFLSASVIAYAERSGVVVPACRIGGGPAGSIDLHWRLPDREVLLNIDADQPAVATFYGDDGTGSQQIKGSLDPAVPAEWLIAWLLGR